MTYVYGEQVLVLRGAPVGIDVVELHKVLRLHARAHPAHVRGNTWIRCLDGGQLLMLIEVFRERLLDGCLADVSLLRQLSSVAPLLNRQVPRLVGIRGV